MPPAVLSALEDRGPLHVHCEHDARRRDARPRQVVASRGHHQGQHQPRGRHDRFAGGGLQNQPVGANEDGNVAGDFDITGAVTIQGAGAGLTIIDGQQIDRVFDVLGTAPSSIKVVFRGLTVRNGK